MDKEENYIAKGGKLSPHTKEAMKQTWGLTDREVDEREKWNDKLRNAKGEEHKRLLEEYNKSEIYKKVKSAMTEKKQEGGATYLNYEGIKDVANKFHSGEMFSKYGLEFAQVFHTKDQAEAHKEYLISHNYEPVILQDKSGEYFVFVKRKDNKSKVQLPKYMLNEQGGAIEKAKNKYAKKDINTLEKYHHSAITDTKHGVLWGEYENGIYTFRVQEKGVMEPKIVFSGNKDQAIEFVKNSYTVAEMQQGGETHNLVPDFYTKNYLKHDWKMIDYLQSIGYTPRPGTNFSTEKNGIDYFIGDKGNKSIVAAFVTDEDNYMITKEDAREMATSARTAGIDNVELHTNYGVELHSTLEKPKNIGFDKIRKVSRMEKGGKTPETESSYWDDRWINIGNKKYRIEKWWNENANKFSLMVHEEYGNSDFPIMYEDGRVVYDRPEQFPKKVKDEVKHTLELINKYSTGDIIQHQISSGELENKIRKKEFGFNFALGMIFDKNNPYYPFGTGETFWEDTLYKSYNITPEMEEKAKKTFGTDKMQTGGQITERSKNIVEKLWGNKLTIGLNNEERRWLEEFVTAYLTTGKFKSFSLRNKSQLNNIQRLIDKNIINATHWMGTGITLTEVARQEVINAVENEGMAIGGEITPHKEVKANQAIAIKEVLKLFPDLKEMEAGFLYNLKNIPDIDDEVRWAKDLKEQIYNKLVDKYYIVDFDLDDTGDDSGSYRISERGKAFINAVDNRLKTRRQVKSGTDLFPETSNIPELKMERGSKIKYPQSYIQEILNYLDQRFGGPSTHVTDKWYDYVGEQVEEHFGLNKKIANKISKRWGQNRSSLEIWAEINDIHKKEEGGQTNNNDTMENNNNNHDNGCNCPATDFHHQLSSEQKEKLGSKYIGEGTTVTDTKTGVVSHIVGILKHGINLLPQSSFEGYPRQSFFVSFKEFLDKFSNGLVDVGGYEHTEPDCKVMHLMIKDIIACHLLKDKEEEINNKNNEVNNLSNNVNSLNERMEEVETEEEMYEEGGVVSEIKYAKNGVVKEVRGMGGELMHSVEVGGQTYRKSPLTKTYNNSDNKVLFKSDIQELSTLKYGGMANSEKTEKSDYYRIRFSSPKSMKVSKTPQWAKNIADSVIEGAKIITYKIKDKLFVERVIIPAENLNEEQAKELAKEIVNKIDQRKQENGGVMFETGTTSPIADTLILFADNTRNLAQMRDEYYTSFANRIKAGQPLTQKSFRAKLLPFFIRTHQQFHKEMAYDEDAINEMNQLKDFDREEFLRVYVEEFPIWARENYEDFNQIKDYLSSIYGRKFARGGKTTEVNYDAVRALKYWNNLTNKQKLHFLFDHSEGYFDKLSKDVTEKENSNYKKFASMRWNELDKKLQSEVIEHVLMGVYENGGEMPNGYVSTIPAEANEWIKEDLENAKKGILVLIECTEDEEEKNNLRDQLKEFEFTSN